MLTPKQMLKKGIFGGTYYNQLGDYRKFPKDGDDSSKDIDEPVAHASLTYSIPKD